MKVVAMFLLLLSSAFIPFNKSVHEKIIGKWHFDTKGRLVFTAIDGEDDGSNMDMEVLTLTETEMKLKFTEDGSYSIVTFYPDKIKAHGSK